MKNNIKISLLMVLGVITIFICIVYRIYFPGTAEIVSIKLNLDRINQIKPQDYQF